MFNLKMPAGSADLGEGPADLGQYEENMNGWGIGATFGVLVKPIDELSIGLTVRTPSTITFKGSALMSYLSMYDLPGSSDLKRKITWPLWIAGGVSFRPVERLLLSADVHWTQWSKLDQITTEYLDTVWAGLMERSGKDVRVLDWKDVTQIRFGAEYTLNATTALRAGYYNDPAPGPLETLNVLLPSHTFNAFSVGHRQDVSATSSWISAWNTLAGTSAPSSSGFPMRCLGFTGCTSSSRRSRSATSSDLLADELEPQLSGRAGPWVEGKKKNG